MVCLFNTNMKTEAFAKEIFSIFAAAKEMRLY